MGQSTKTRSFTDKEVKLMQDSFNGVYAIRNRALFILGIRTGFRISELLQLTIAHVVDGSWRPVDRITVTKTKTKRPRTVVFHPEAQEAVCKWVDELRKLGIGKTNTFLFVSQRGERITPNGAWRIIHQEARDNGLQGVIGPHSMRKTLGMRAYKKTKDILKVAKVLGHESVDATIHYLEIGQEEVDELILGL